MNRTRCIGGDTGCRNGSSEYGRTAAIHGQGAKRTVGLAANRAGKGHVAAAGTYRQAVCRGCRRINLTGEQDRIIASGQSRGRAQGNIPGVGLAVGTGDGVRIDGGCTGNLQRRQTGHRICSRIAKHRVTRNLQTVTGAGHGPVGGYGAAGKNRIIPQRQGVIVRLGTACGYRGTINLNRTRRISGNTGGGNCRTKLAQATAVDCYSTQRMRSPHDTGQGDVAGAGCQGQGTGSRGITINRTAQGNITAAGIGGHGHISLKGNAGGKGNIRVGGADIAGQFIQTGAILRENTCRRDIAICCGSK